MFASKHYALLLLALAFVVGRAEADVRTSVDRYRSGEAMVTVECFAPTAKGKHPVVLLLHGSGGLEQATGEAFRGMARGMAGKGYLVLIPHYHEASGHAVGQDVGREEFESWVTSVKDALAFADSRFEADLDRIGLFGFSAGAHVATRYAEGDPRVLAISQCSAASPSESPRPTLLLVGAKDPGVQGEPLKRLTDAMDAAKVAHSVHVYKGEGHNLHIQTFVDAGRRTSAFFDKHVKRADPKAAPKPDAKGDADNPAPKAAPARDPKGDADQPEGKAPSAPAKVYRRPQAPPSA